MIFVIAANRTERSNYRRCHSPEIIEATAALLRRNSQVTAIFSVDDEVAIHRPDVAPVTVVPWRLKSAWQTPFVEIEAGHFVACWQEFEKHVQA